MSAIKNTGNKRNDLLRLASVIIIFVGMICLFFFYILPTILNEEHNFPSEPIHLNSEWENVSKYDNTERPFPWIVESRDRPEIPITYDSFISLYNQEDIVDVKYVIKKNHIKLYGLEEIIGKNGSYFYLRTTILSPERNHGPNSKFSEYRIDRGGSVIFIETDTDITLTKFFMKIIVGALILTTLYLIREFVIILSDKDYKSKKEIDKETRS